MSQEDEENRHEPESEMDVLHMTKHEKVTPSDFELLKVLGQGSFGKVGGPLIRICSFRQVKLAALNFCKSLDMSVFSNAIF